MIIIAGEKLVIYVGGERIRRGERERERRE